MSPRALAPGLGFGFVVGLTMTRKQWRSYGYKCAAALIESMDFNALFGDGDETYESAHRMDHMEAVQSEIVTYLRKRAKNN
jgi:hypothetical protein